MDIFVPHEDPLAIKLPLFLSFHKHHAIANGTIAHMICPFFLKLEPQSSNKDRKEAGVTHVKEENFKKVNIHEMQRGSARISD